AAGGYVGLLSLTNMGGRFIWSTVSDYIGRKNIYLVYLGVGAGLYFLLASLGSQSLALFVVSTLIILSFYGGGFATVPAYLKDLFGVYQVGAIHGRLLTAWSAAGVAGPLLVNSIVESSRTGGGEGFELYRLSLFIMAGILGVGLISNILIRPASEKHFADPAMVAQRREAERPAAAAAAGAREQAPARAAAAGPRRSGSRCAWWPASCTASPRRRSARPPSSSAERRTPHTELGGGDSLISLRRPFALMVAPAASRAPVHLAPVTGRSHRGCRHVGLLVAGERP